MIDIHPRSRSLGVWLLILKNPGNTPTIVYLQSVAVLSINYSYEDAVNGNEKQEREKGEQEKEGEQEKDDEKENNISNTAFPDETEIAELDIWKVETWSDGSQNDNGNG